MDFENLNQLNALINVLSGNMLPTRPDRKRAPTILNVYWAFVWSVQLAYQTVCIIGVFYVSKEKSMKDSTVNIVVSVEVILLLVHLNHRKNLLRRLIEQMNAVLSVNDETLRNTVIKMVKPLQKPLKIYTIVTVGSVFAWAGTPFIKILQRDQFTYEDYKIPAVLSGEPFPATIFVVGILLQMAGAGYVIFKKTSLDIYTMHLILLVTSQYRYMRTKLAMIFEDGEPMIRNDDRCNFDYVRTGEIFLKDRRSIKKDLNMLIHHHGSVVQIVIMLKKLLGPNMSVLYIDNVFRFCFLGLMLITVSAEYFERSLVFMYTLGAVTQLYVLCFCIQKLFEASTTVTDLAFHAKWYAHDKSFQRMFATMILANKLECRLSTFRSIDLTLPSFMSEKFMEQQRKQSLYIKRTAGALNI